MRPVQFQSSALHALLGRQQMATMEELKRALGTTVEMTVLRKLRPLGYLSSYSHGGKFYTLTELARFDERGLWRVGEVRFSRVGSLVDTAEDFVVGSPAGYYAAELNGELGVETKQALLTLVRGQRVVREEIAGLQLHCAPDPRGRRVQLANRMRGVALPTAVGRKPPAQIAPEAKAALLLFVSTLNERQRRLYVGMESLRVGHGGDRWIAQLTGLDVHTVARGRRELLAQDLELDAIRRQGGGRPAVEKKRRR